LQKVLISDQRAAEWPGPGGSYARAQRGKLIVWEQTTNKKITRCEALFDGEVAALRISHLTAVFACEFREPFQRLGGVNVEEVANQYMAWRARDRLKMRRVFHAVSPLGAFHAVLVCGWRDVGSSRQRVPRRAAIGGVPASPQAMRTAALAGQHDGLFASSKVLKDVALFAMIKTVCTSDNPNSRK
jgi:hypothetical protein